jgi:hypothetical protein
MSRYALAAVCWALTTKVQTSFDLMKPKLSGLLHITKKSTTKTKSQNLGYTAYHYVRMLE